MTEEQNKLAEEIADCIYANSFHAPDGSHEPRLDSNPPAIYLLQEALAAFREREPATEAVLDDLARWKEQATKNEQRRWELAQQALALVALIKVGRDIGQSREAYDFQLCLAAKKIEDICPIEAALKGKGASQGVEEDK